MNQNRVIELIKDGYSLTSGVLGAWLMNPIDSRCTNVRIDVFRALVKHKKIIKSSKVDGNIIDWIINNA